jgi:hypothetical protein
VDVLAVILACSLYPDDALVRALVEIQSEGNVYFIGDTSTLQSKDGLKSAEDALHVADGIRSQGGRPAVGLLGLPLDWAARYERSPASSSTGAPTSPSAPPPSPSTTIHVPSIQARR